MIPVVTPLIIVQAWQIRTGDLEFIRTTPWPVRSAFVGVCLATILLLNRSAGIPFIYFQF